MGFNTDGLTTESREALERPWLFRGLGHQAQAQTRRTSAASLPRTAGGVSAFFEFQ